MTKKITIDRAGRVIIPQPVRKALRLSPGDSLQLDTSGDEITLRPLRLDVPLKKESGVWVFRSKQPAKHVSIVNLIDDVRDDRSRDMLR